MNTQITSNSSNSYTSYGIYFFGYIILLISLVLYFVYSDNEKAFNYSTLGFVILTFVVLGVTVYYFYPHMKNKSTDLTVTYAVAAIITFASTISWIFLTIEQSNLKILGNVFLVVFIIFLIIALAIVFYIFGDYLKQRRGVAGLIINFIFFIPCLLLDFIEFMKREMHMTTKTEYILLLLEILLIISYFFAVPLINATLASSTVYLLKKPVFLNKQKVLLSDTSSLSIERNVDLSLVSNTKMYNITNAPTATPGRASYNPIDVSAHIYSSNFAISLWTYLNVQTREFSVDMAGNSYEANIFSYGAGKPRINYTNDINDAKQRDKYNFYFTDSATTPNYQITMPSQKWNNIVFNYSGDKVDLFINGNLETTFYFDETNKLPHYSEIDNITVGQNSKGLNGAICNVVYYKTNLLNNQIVNDYNVLMLKNPPVAQI